MVTAGVLGIINGAAELAWSWCEGRPASDPGWMLYSGLSALRVAGSFAAFYFVVPSVFWPRGKKSLALSLLEWAVLGGSSVYLVVHLLAWLKLYDSLSLWAGYLACLALMAGVAGGRPISRAAEAVRAGWRLALDAVEDTPAMVALLGSYWRELSRVWRQKIPSPALMLAGTGVLALLVWTRGFHALRYWRLASSDAYVHLVWIQQLKAGILYPDRIYPFGMHAMVSALSWGLMLDARHITRHLPMVAVGLMALALYATGLRLSRRWEGGILACWLLAWGLRFLAPHGAWRQVSALPQELSMTWMMAGLLMWDDFVRHGHRKSMVLAGTVLALCTGTHPIGTVFWAIGAAAILVTQRTFPKRFQSAVLVVGLAAIWAAWPVVVARALGFGVRRGAVQVVPVRWAAPRVNILPGFPSMLRHLWVVCAVLLELMSRPGPLVAGATATTAGAWLATSMGALGLPSPVNPVRAVHFLALGWIVLVGAAVGTCVGRLRRWAGALSVLVLAVTVVLVPVRPPIGERYEYDGVVLALEMAARTFTPYDWTVVATTHQLGQVMGRGWHYELWRFLEDAPEDKAADPSFYPPVKTPHLLVVVEKIPLVPTITAAMLGEPEDAEDLVVRYYLNVRKRAELQSRIHHWCLAYASTHPGVRVFYEDQSVVVYYIPVPQRHR